MYRQGDILMAACTALPCTVQKQSDRVLAEGEATGHTHQVMDEAFVWVDTDGTKYVEVYGAQARLVHEEHGPITLPGPAVYRMIRQRQYVAGEVRNVAD